MAAPPPGTARLHHLLGVALEWCGLREGAAQAFRDAIKGAPDHAHTWFRLGDALARGGRWKEASEAFAEASRRVPESPEYQGNLALSLARASDWDGAVRALRRLAQLRPHEGEGYVLLGSVLKKMKRQDEAIRAFRWAVRLRPSPSSQRFVLGEAFLGEAGWREALDAWRDARGLGSDPDPRNDNAAGRSALHRHPGGPLAPAAARGGRSLGRERKAASAPRSPRGRGPLVAARDCGADLRREERDRSILHVFREARPFPIREGDRPATVHVSPAHAREGRRAPGTRP